MIVLGIMLTQEYPKMKGLDGLKQMMGMAFPDYHETIQDIISEGDRI